MRGARVGRTRHDVGTKYRPARVGPLVGIRGAVVAALLLALAAVPSAAGRQRRLHLPEKPLPRALTVDESEWALRPSKRIVAAGEVKVRVYNRGEDDHDLVVVDQRGETSYLALKPGTDGTITPRLTPGTYKFYCSLQAGTPESHQDRGMVFWLEVR